MRHPVSAEVCLANILFCHTIIIIHGVVNSSDSFFVSIHIRIDRVRLAQTLELDFICKLSSSGARKVPAQGKVKL